MENAVVFLIVFGGVGLLAVIILDLMTKARLKEAELKGTETDKFAAIVEEIKGQNTAMLQELGAIREKVEAMEKMMKDI